MSSGMDLSQMLGAVDSLTSAIQRNEHGKNDLIEQVLHNKLSEDFVVTCKPLTKRRGKSLFEIKTRYYSTAQRKMF